MFNLDRPVSGVWIRPKISRKRKIQEGGGEDTPPHFSCDVSQTKLNFWIAERSMAARASQEH